MQKNHTFYFISYPLGAGGAHLANVISLEPTFSPKNSHLDKVEFLNYLNFFYSSENNNQHIDNHKIVNDKSWKEELPSIIDKFSNSVHLPTHCSLIEMLCIQSYIGKTDEPMSASRTSNSL